jgi:type III pantothenate kinase
VILTVLVGNTNTRLCWFKGREIEHRAVQPTAAPPRIPRPGRLDGAAIASVVPAATPRWLAALRRAGIGSPLVVTPRIDTGLRFRYRHSQLGVDRVCAAVGAHAKYSGDVTVIDFGTAITANAVTGQGEFIGGYILPGPDMMFAALNRSTAQLPLVRSLGSTDRLPRTTEDAIRAGVMAAVAGGVNDAVARVRRETGRACWVVLTGGRAGDFAPLMRAVPLIEPDIASYGLAVLYRMNIGGTSERPRH